MADHRPHRSDSRPPGDKQEMLLGWAIRKREPSHRPLERETHAAAQRRELLSPPPINIRLNQEFEKAAARGVVWCGSDGVGDETLRTFGRKFRRLAEKSRLDKNVWFGNVEHAAARRVGRETVDYVGNIYKYYVAYKLARDKQRARAGSG